MEGNPSLLVFHELNVVTGEQVLAFGAGPHLAERPPEFQGVTFSKKNEFTTGSFGQ
jgi:hypothetical protein